VAAGATLAMLAYFWLIGGLSDFWEAVVVYNQSYAGSLIANLVASVSSEYLLLERFDHLEWVVGFGLVGLAVGLAVERTGLRRLCIFLVVYLICAHTMIAMPGRFYGHYYQLALPVIAIAFGVATSAFRSLLSGRPKWTVDAAAAVLVLLLARHELPLLWTDEKEWADGRYHVIYMDARRIGSKLGSDLRPDARIYQWGGESAVYFYSSLRPASGIFYSYSALSKSPLQREHSERILADLQRTKPEVVVIAKRMREEYDPTHRILRWLEENYELCGEGCDLERFEIRCPPHREPVVQTVVGEARMKPSDPS